jgi:hypothetical protein
MKTSIVVAMLFLLCSAACAEYLDTPAINTTDTLYVKYQFWSPPKYSIDTKTWRSANSFFSMGSYKPDFKAYFSKETDAYVLMKRTENKLILGNCIFALPGGACIGAGLAYIGPAYHKKNVGYALLTTGVVLALGDFLIGISSFKDLTKAVSLRNTSLEKH